MIVPACIFLAINAGGPGAHGWGATISTDTAFALGALALLTPRAATRLRVFLLTLAVVDDVCALLVIATVYTSARVRRGSGDRGGTVRGRSRSATPRVAARGVGDRRVGIWVALFESGVDPVISGLAVGLATSAYPPSREDLERATVLRARSASSRHRSSLGRHSRA